jgi:hypothetical protein
MMLGKKTPGMQGGEEGARRVFGLVWQMVATWSSRFKRLPANSSTFLLVLCLAGGTQTRTRWEHCSLRRISRSAKPSKW